MKPIRRGIPLNYPDWCSACNKAMSREEARKAVVVGSRLLCPDCAAEETDCQGCGTELREEYGGYCPACS